jgi:mRNA-degrading endonuclease YafQ of YafQ-DinJ toxin-antitoxin module
LSRLPASNNEISGGGKFLEEILSSFRTSEGKRSFRLSIFKRDPFDPRLGTHRISSLSARYKKIIYSVMIEADLRIVFYIEDDVVHTLDVGTHSIYR